MRRIAPRLSTASTLALIIGSLGAETPAFAQSSPAPAPESCAAVKDEAAKQSCADAATQVDPLANQGEQAALPTKGGAASAESGGGPQIVVTGSRLRRDERTSSDPVTIIDPNVQNRQGRLDTAEILQTSPIAAGSTQITSTLSSNFVFNGGEGVQTIGLRGLGSNRTLVLLNGRRAGPAGVRGGVSAFDLNVIPQDVIQSVEILKTGASSVYGSDAIAGVVNLITRKDLRGLQVRGFATVPTRSGGETYDLSASYGIGLGDRGHASISASWNKVSELENGDRSFLGCSQEYITNPAGQRVDPIDPRTGEFYCGGLLSNIVQFNDVGLIEGNNLRGPLVPSVAGGLTRRPIGAAQFGPDLAQYLGAPGQSGLFFNPADPSSVRVPTGFFPVGSFSPAAQALQNSWDPRANSDSIIPATKRFTVYAEGDYDITDDVNLYFEGLYNRRQTRTDGSRQLFFYQFPHVGSTVYTNAYGGYYLPYFFCDGSTCDPNAQGDPLNQGFTGGALLRPVIYAPANSGTDVKYFRGVAGAHANLDKWLRKGFADLYFQHSRSNGDYHRDIIYRDAVEFGVAELRTDLCAGTLTAIRHVPCIDINYTDPRALAGNFTQQERAFLFGVDKGNTKYRQNTAEFSFGGELFKLPGGAIKFALGGQYRRDSINDTPGAATQAGNIWQSTVSGITAGRQRTLEAFGETELPLLANLPLIKELTLNGAARYTTTKSTQKSDGATDTDRAWTYKIAGNWRPFTPIRFRATFGTSFRSPALFEQFLANESGFVDPTSDPCFRYDLSENAEIRQNCAAQGIPGDFAPANTFQSFSGGGVGVLNPETSKALTLSAILTPDGWLWRGGQFSFAVDYVDIKVRNEVSQLGPQQILTACYTSDNFPTDPACALFTRAPAGAADEFQIRTLRDPYLNIDRQRNKSIDFTMRYRQNLGSLGSLSALAQATYQLKDVTELFAGTKQDFNGEAGDPKWVGDLNLTWSKAPWTVTYGLQLIAGTNDIRNLRDLGGTQLTADNCLATPSGFAVRGGPYCPVYKLPRVAYHSLSVELQATKDLSVLVGMANIFNKKPPLVSTIGAPITALGQTPAAATQYDYLGRRLFVTARARFKGFGR